MTTLSIYKKYFEKKNINLDQEQMNLVKKLVKYNEQIDEYKKERKNTLVRIFKNPKINKGFYISGEVGRGKSMISQAFYDNANLIKKKKLSYNGLIAELHQDIHQKTSENKSLDIFDYLEEVAEKYSKKHRLLYIDEFEVQDISDAMIIGKFFRSLFEKNIMIIITSNRRPDELYQNGLQRELFLEFVKIMKTKLSVLELNSDTDYRRKKVADLNKTYFFPLGKSATQFIKKNIDTLTNKNPLYEKVINVGSRKICCNRVFKNLVCFTFAELFLNPYGKTDFLELCKNFNIIIVEDIPQLKPEDREEARRMIDFIDILYENKIIFISSCATPPEMLYLEGKNSFEFKRTISRLIEMQSKEYLNGSLC